MNGTQAPPFTTFYGLYDRRYSFKNTEEPAWELPKTYLEKKNSLDLSVPLNFVYDADTIGGNSGSPVINTKGELLGINFDRNILHQIAFKSNKNLFLYIINKKYIKIKLLIF